MGISYTPIYLSENVVYKITNSKFQQVLSVDKSNVYTDVAVWTSVWSSDDNKLVELFRIHMLLTPLRLVLVLRSLNVAIMTF